MDKQFKDYYLILEVHMLASVDVIKASYKRLSIINHPDNKGDKEKFYDLKEAYKVLSNHMLRTAYNKKWKANMLKGNPKLENGMQSNSYDIAFGAVKETLVEYMYFIMNEEFEMAYHLLSQKNKKHIFRKDFIIWQTLISEIHELIKFDCVLESFDINEYERTKLIKYKVKITEFNKLLNRVEEDYFSRNLVFEQGGWKIVLSDINLKRIIKKYKRIISINKKRSKKLLKIDFSSLDAYSSKVTSLSNFINNCEYEFLRYQRYKRPFSVIKLCINSKDLTVFEVAVLEKVLEKYTRNLDAFTHFKEDVILILLPETNNTEAQVVIRKLSKRLHEQFNERQQTEVKQLAFTIEETFLSTKEFLNYVSKANI